MDFDQKHERFGTFEVYFEDITNDFGKKSNTIKEWHDGLVSKGFIGLVDKRKRLFEIKSPLRYLTGQTWGGKSIQFAMEEKSNPTLEFLLQNICFNPNKIQIKSNIYTDFKAESPTKAISSSKDECKVNPLPNSLSSNKKIVVIYQTPRTDEEYKKIQEEGSEMTIDDMRWIDKNVKEKIEIRDDEHEKEVVRIYFDGNWSEYRKHLINS